ncbi:MAG: ABC transporter permease [Lachnospiraceae bacterium]|nr:ABC transporter permease [Lachnospiraceae bacterium]
MAELFLEGDKSGKKKLNLKLTIGAALVLLTFSLALIGFFYTPYEPNSMDSSLRSAAPSLSHLFGTDNFGRDIFSRVMKGSGTSVLIAASVVFIGTFFGIVVGTVSGYYGGLLDEILMRFNDIVASFPGVLIALVLVAVIGPGEKNVIIALGIVFIPSFVRMVRADVVGIKSEPYIMAARLMGTSDFKIMLMHIVPNIRTTILTSVFIGFQNAILSEAALSFLGLGVVRPDPSLGLMLSDAQGYLFNAPWYAIAPGLIIVVMTLGFGLISNVLEGE